MHVNPLHLFHLRNDVILKCHFTAPITFVDLIVLKIYPNRSNIIKLYMFHIEIDIRDKITEREADDLLQSSTIPSCSWRVSNSRHSYIEL